MNVVNVVEHYGHCILTANIDGNYDKRGLPDPLVLTFYFSLHGDQIVQLIILQSVRFLKSHQLLQSRSIECPLSGDPTIGVRFKLEMARGEVTIYAALQH